jgi:hypothetical protein
MDGHTQDPSADRVGDPRAWQAPQLTVLGSLASQTVAQQVSAPDSGGSGTLAGDSGSTF